MPPRNTADLNVATPGMEDSPRELRSGRRLPSPATPTTPSRRRTRQDAAATTRLATVTESNVNERATAPGSPAALSPRDVRMQTRTARRGTGEASSGVVVVDGNNEGTTSSEDLGANANNDEAGNTTGAHTHVETEPTPTVSEQISNQIAVETETTAPHAPEESNNQNTAETEANHTTVPEREISQNAPTDGAPVNRRDLPPAVEAADIVSSIDPDDQCYMCHERLNYIDQDACSMWPCGHGALGPESRGGYHWQCIDAWYREYRGTSPTCVYCRGRVTELRQLHPDGTSTIVSIEAQSEFLHDTGYRLVPQNSSPSPARPAPPSSDVSMPDVAPPPAATWGTRRTAPGWVLDSDRLNPRRKILKEIEAVYKARRGHRFLLRCNVPGLPIYELEAQSKFPGAMASWQAEHGYEVKEPAPISVLEGRDWEDLEILGAASVRQNRRVTSRMEVPKLHAETIVELSSRDGEIRREFFEHHELNVMFGANIVRQDVREHRQRIGQHLPIEPERHDTSRSSPASRIPPAQNPAFRSPPDPLASNDEDLESYYMQQLYELWQRRENSRYTNYTVNRTSNEEAVRRRRMDHGQAPPESTL